MKGGLEHISVCVCTFKRPDLLLRLLEELARQETGGEFTYSIVISDNDAAQSARDIVLNFAAALGPDIPILYCVEPERNIALARNRAVANARGDFIAFIDDDEYPSPTWLRELLHLCTVTGADGVLGPVIPYFESDPPGWLRKGKFFERPTHATGFWITLLDMRTSNVLLRAELLQGPELPFRAEFGSGGEDVDFFRRKTDKGAHFVWCNEAEVYEMVPEWRLKRSYICRRALHRGNISYKFPELRRSGVMKALVALPLYLCSLPFLRLAGDHHFMRYLVKCCDHAGLLLAFFRLTPFRVYK
ncbi:succinoglycan biosynthesis protein ExoM [Geomonas sp. Red276]